MNRKKLIIVAVILGICCLASIVIAAAAVIIIATQSKTNQTVDTTNQTPVSTGTTNTTTNTTPEPAKNTWTITSKSDVQETSNFKVDIVYPVLVNAEHKTIADNANEYIKSLVTAARTEVTTADPSGAYSKPSINLDYEVKFLNDSLVSIIISGSEYLGGAHPGSVFITVNYDLANDNPLALADIFNAESGYLTTLSANFRAELAMQLGVDATDSQLVGGTSATADNFKLFYISGTDSVEDFGMIFSDYQVAPYAAGPQTVELDVDVVSGMFNSEFTALL